MATREQVIDAIIAEAIGEGDDGMAGVAWTMQNRALEAGKPLTSVVTKGAYSGLANPGRGVIQAQRNPQVRARVERILNGVESGSIPDPTGGATHYWSPKGMQAMGKGDPYWASAEESAAGRLTIGGHVYLPKRAPDVAAAPTPATMPDALRSRIPATALAAIDAASGATSMPAPELAYAGMPATLSSAVQRVQETSAPQARLPDISAPSLGQREVAQSIIERVPPKPPVPQRLLDALGSGSASARLNGDIAPASPAKEVNLAFDPGAVEAQVNSIPQDAGLLAALTRRVAPNSASDRARANEAQTRNVATTIASIPTGPALASLAPAPARLPDIAPQRVSVPQSIIERGYPAAPTQPGGRVDYGQGPGGVGIMPSMQGMESLVAGNNGNAFGGDFGIPSAPARSGVGAPPATRVVPSVAVTSPKPSLDAVGSGASWSDLQNTMETPIPLGNVMASAAPRIDDIGAGSSWSDFTGTLGPRTQIAQPTAPPKAQERLSTPQLSALSFSPQAQAQGALPNKQQLEEATGFRTVMQDEKIINPAWTAYRAANPAQATRVGSAVPLGEMTYTGSRDSKAAAMAGRNFAANNMPAKFITVKKPARVPVVSAPRFVPAAASAVAPMPVAPFAPMNNLTRHPVLNMLAAMIGPSDTPIGKLLGNGGPRAPVGASLGVAGNGGNVTQGHSGTLNSTTQDSDAWKRATGQSGYGSGQSNDTKYESYF